MWQSHFLSIGPGSLAKPALLRFNLLSPLIQTLYLAELREIIPDLTIRRLVFNEVERRLDARAHVAGGELVMSVPMLCISAVRD